MIAIRLPFLTLVRASAAKRRAAKWLVLRRLVSMDWANTSTLVEHGAGGCFLHYVDCFSEAALR